ncbi:MAG: serine/threonine protein kinase [Bacteroidetes bacterium HGW-Bacteroidetes-4]|jgi:recombinational DNA repair protein RecT|nr:MAG: serine/threonine protein kinase [Bacteroidetes bacterium HGW-Bacteroidetes-4]
MDRKNFFNKELPTLKPVEIIEHPVTEKRFVDIFTQIHGSDGLIAYEREKFYFSKILTENPELAQCTPLSLFSVFLDVATKGLTLDNGSKALCYITFRNAKIKTKNEKNETVDKWEKRALLDISGYGELVLRERAGQVRYADNPEVIYEGEEYVQENTPDGARIYHKITHPRPTTKIILIYVRIVRPDGSVTFGTLDQEGIERLKNYSAENNGKWVKDATNNDKLVKVKGEANRLYDDIGFLKAKCLKHAFLSFPKLKLNNFSALEAVESPEDLGLPADVVKETSVPKDEPKAEPKAEKANTDDFPDNNQGVTVNDDDMLF